jgi:menaquinone-9 beta-reductase
MTDSGIAQKADIAIIGGGLAGLVAANLLADCGYRVTLFEKKDYPFHRVCGEYVSNEVLDFLERNTLLPPGVVRDITQFELSTIKGRSFMIDLPLGGFGISRFSFDDYLQKQARTKGVQLLTNCTVHQCTFNGISFTIETSLGQFESTICLGAWGKRSRIDKDMQRPFAIGKSPYVGIKYHVHHDFPADRIALHNFDGGYCGISRVEDARVNLCYLVKRERLRRAGTIPQLEQQFLFQNPQLRAIWESADFIFEQPLVINEISFAPKKAIEQHMLMIGDTAGLITPLCGNGMAMAIHSAKIAAELIHQHLDAPIFYRESLEQRYQQAWKQSFSTRLKAGRFIQSMFGNTSANLAVSLLAIAPSLARKVVQLTHGEVI